MCRLVTLVCKCTLVICYNNSMCWKEEARMGVTLARALLALLLKPVLPTALLTISTLPPPPKTRQWQARWLQLLSTPLRFRVPRHSPPSAWPPAAIPHRQSELIWLIARLDSFKQCNPLDSLGAHQGWRHREALHAKLLLWWFLVAISRSSSKVLAGSLDTTVLGTSRSGTFSPKDAIIARSFLPSHFFRVEISPY